MEIDEERWNEAVRTAKALDAATRSTTYVFMAAVMLYCTGRIVRAVRAKREGT